jgi:hypothetical protein
VNEESLKIFFEKWEEWEVEKKRKNKSEETIFKKTLK